VPKIAEAKIPTGALLRTHGNVLISCQLTLLWTLAIIVIIIPFYLLQYCTRICESVICQSAVINQCYQI